MAGPLQGETLLPEQIAGLLGLEGALGATVGALIGAFVVGNVMLAQTGVAGPWAKRKITAAFTDRIAVDRVGPFGLFIIIADSVRLLSKELINPDGADRPSYDLAPLILPASAMLGFAVIPMGGLGPFNIQLADPEAGLALVFAFASIASVSLVMGGYASNNKYSLMGGLRAVAQNIAYEIPLIVTAMSVVVFTGSLQMSTIVAEQSTTLLSVPCVSIPAWFSFVNPFAFGFFLWGNRA